MEYPKELVDEVKELYHNDEEIIEALETNSSWLGLHLNICSTDSIAFDVVLESISLDELKKEVRILKRKRELYFKWKEFYNSNR